MNRTAACCRSEGLKKRGLLETAAMSGGEATGAAAACVVRTAASAATTTLGCVKADLS